MSFDFWARSTIRNLQQECGSRGCTFCKDSFRPQVWAWDTVKCSSQDQARQEKDSPVCEVASPGAALDDMHRHLLGPQRRWGEGSALCVVPPPPPLHFSMETTLHPVIYFSLMKKTKDPERKQRVQGHTGLRLWFSCVQ